MDYYNGGGDYVSLQDMIDCDISSEMGGDPYAPSGDGTSICMGPGTGSSLQSSAARFQVSGQHLQQVHHVDLDSSVSNLSWLHAVNVGALHQQPENRNPNLMVNPQTVTPVNSSPASSSSPLRVIEVTLPSNIQITGSTVRYVTVPTATHQVYISTGKPAMSSHQKPVQINNQSYHQQQHGYLTTAVASPSSGIDNPYPKPAYSYSCLIAMALKNSKTGSLPVSEIYSFMTSNFPYFKTAPDGWKNSVRHNLSLNKCFEKIENPNSDGSNSRKGCLWSLNPAKARKMDEEIAKWNKKDPVAIKRSMAKPEVFDALEKGTGNGSAPLHPNCVERVDNLSGAASMSYGCPSGDCMAAAMKSEQSNASCNGGGGSMSVHEHHRMCGDNSAAAASAVAEYINEELALDPALSDLAFQNSLWDEFSGEVLDLPFTGSPSGYISSPKLGSPRSTAMSPETLTRYHGTYICKPTAPLVAAPVSEGFRTHGLSPAARFVPAAT